MSDRFSRQEDLVPQDKLRNIYASVIGVGATGRQVALQLAAIGIQHLYLYDHDLVDPNNVTTQCYRAADIGKAKVKVMAKDIRAIDSEIDLHTFPRKYAMSDFLGDVCFCCVDGITTRGAIWQDFPKDNQHLWLDSRVGGETVRILSAVDATGRAHYPETIFTPDEGATGRCTTQMTIYIANIAAGLLVATFSKWLRGITPDPDIVLNVSAMEMDAMKVEHVEEAEALLA